MKTIDQVQDELGIWLIENFPQPPTIEQQGLVMAEECGEVAQCILKRAQGIRGDAEVWTDRLEEEVADAIITLLAIAEMEDFDAQWAVSQRWATVQKRNFNEGR
jgi:NTP pyrophosphatase (non-canonical NTP hydrolase)